MKRRAIRKYIVLTVSTLFSVFLIIVILLLNRFLHGDVREEKDDIADYGQWLVPEKYTQLLIFPGEIPDSAEHIEYYYKYENGWTRPMCQIFLSYTLDTEEYEKEEERLSSLSCETGEGGLLTVQKDLTSFQYPAYVTIAGYDFCYEYALLYEKEHVVIYIYAMNTVEDDLKFNGEFLPDYFMEGFDDLSVLGTDRFTMYGGYD